MRFVHYFTALAALGFTFVGARSAMAAACVTDADCGAGFACEVVGQSGACTAGPCTPEGECPPPVCEPVLEELGCVPAACNSGADCPTDMVCFAFPSEDCADPAPCVSPEGCPEPTCIPSSEQRCLPGWLPPVLGSCATDAECGVGFRCAVEPVSCDCAVAEPTAPAAGGAAAIPVPTTGGAGGGDSCTCTPSEERSCELVPQACDTSAACPTGWTCEANPMQGECSGGSTGFAPGVGGAASDPMPVEVVCPPPDPARICLPPHALEVAEALDGANLDLGGESDDSGGTPEVGPGAPGTAGTASGGTTARPGSTTGGVGGGTASGGGDTDTPTEGPAPGTSDENAAEATSSDDGGCQMAAPTGSFGGGLAGMMAGLALLGLRRRRTR